ncbi:MAG: hypothetical protein IPI30_03820 [Saprospiraceae bacterium]|nr:hypothetical protein [Candidatus Vicinibacter affinis]
MNINLSHILSTNELSILNSLIGSRLYSIHNPKKSYLLIEKSTICINYPSLIILNCVQIDSKLNSVSICVKESIKFEDFSIYNLVPNHAVISNENSELLELNITVDLIEIYHGKDKFISLQNDFLNLFLTSEFSSNITNGFNINNIAGIIISENCCDSLLIMVNDYSIVISSDILEINNFKMKNKLFYTCQK